MASFVDRRFARVIAYKRIVTGSMSLVGGTVLAAALAWHGSATVLGWLGLAIFFLGGSWTLRDGLRLRRELGQASPDAPPRG